MVGPTNPARRARGGLALALALALAPEASAQTPPPWAVPLPLASPSDGAWRARAAELLSVALRSRTSVEAQGVLPTALTHGALFAFPLLLWSGRDAVALDGPSTAALGEFLSHGGVLLIDGDPVRDAAFLRSAERALEAVLPGARSEPLSQRDVLVRTFYLLAPSGPLSPGDVRVTRSGRALSVIESRGDALGALVGPDGPRREGALRFLVNVVLYALCLDYKDDQVHAPFLMRRRRGAP